MTLKRKATNITLSDEELAWFESDKLNFGAEVSRSVLISRLIIITQDLLENLKLNMTTEEFAYLLNLYREKGMTHIKAPFNIALDVMNLNKVISPSALCEVGRDLVNKVFEFNQYEQFVLLSKIAEQLTNCQASKPVVSKDHRINNSNTKTKTKKK